MFINELSEPQLLVVYPGRFQPFHKGHHAVYEYLAGKFGRNNVYIATSNKTDGAKSPFSFAEKAYFMQLTGVPGDRIIQATSPYRLPDVVAGGNLNIPDEANTVAIFAISEKDMAEDPRFASFTKKDGTPAFFQKMPAKMSETEGMHHHAYILTVPTFDFTVLGKPMQSGTELRKMYAEADTKTRQLIIKDLFGKYTAEAEQLMTAKLAPQAPAELPRPTKLPKTAKPVGGQVAKPVKVKPVKAISEAGGVGVVKGGNDPRYCMATAGDQNSVNGKTLGKEMAGFGLTGRKSPGAPRQQRPIKGRIGQGLKTSLKEADILEDLAWVKSRLGESAVDALAAKHIEYITQDIDAIKQRLNTENLPANYVEVLKKKIAALEAERAKLAFNPQ